jgi:hypothetical protein
METEMVEPDRTIMIVSIIGLVVIWGSFFYHKYVQGGHGAVQEVGEAASVLQAPAESAEAIEEGDSTGELKSGGNKQKAKKRKKR